MQAVHLHPDDVLLGGKLYILHVLLHLLLLFVLFHLYKKCNDFTAFTTTSQLRILVGFFY